MKKFVLSNGVDIPQLGYGSAIVLTYMYGDYSRKTIIKYWMKNFIKNRTQYRKDIGIGRVLNSVEQEILIDTSRAYGGSEFAIGKAIKSKGRDKFFIVTKLCNGDQYNHSVMEGFEKSLEQLGVDYVDLYLMHWPVEGEYINSWKEMEKIYQSGRARAIGVCNCNIRHLEEIKKKADVIPMVNQFECHPLFTQEKLCNYCKENNIQIMAYTSTGRMDERLNKTVIPVIAEKYNKTSAQIIIKWHIQKGIIPLVNTSNVKHLKDNFNIWDFNLTQEEIEKISAVNINSRLRYDPENCDFRQL